MRDDRRFVPLLALALVCAGAAAATVAAKTTGGSATTTLVATNPHVSVSLPATSTAAPTTTTGPAPTVTTGTLPVAPGPPSTAATTTAPPPPPPPRPRTAAIRSWPSGHRGYTVVLQSLPESLGRAAAVARAEQARRAGVAAVGVLRSGDFSSLRAGYWVVFAGDFATSEQAQSAAGADRARGSAGAYPAAVTP